MVYFSNFNFNRFWDDSEYAKEEYMSKPPTNEIIYELENELGYKLPESYVWLMEKQNGGVPVKDCFPINSPTSWSDDHISISGIYGGSSGSRFWIEEWEYPDIGVAICNCPSAGHQMVFLDYRGCGPQGEPCVVSVDQDNDYKITCLAPEFESFIRGLVSEEVFDESIEDTEIDDVEIWFSEDLLNDD